jgi:hypothetical protein
MKALLIGITLTIVLGLGVEASASLVRHTGGLNPTAFIFRPEARYDPLIQRLLAEDVLRAMPMGERNMFYVVPEGGTQLLEEMQIRYLEELLQRYGSNAEPVEN